jgi:hypothetical protein
LGPQLLPYLGHRQQHFHDQFPGSHYLKLLPGLVSFTFAKFLANCEINKVVAAVSAALCSNF